MLAERLLDFAAATASEQSGVAHVKLPSFWLKSPELWYCQADCIFVTKGVAWQLRKFLQCYRRYTP
jgi:hypothetical protein